MALGGLVLDLAEAGELVERLLGAVEVTVDPRADALEFLCEGTRRRRIVYGVKRDDPSWPQPSSAAATSVMRANRSRDTAPELALRSLLHRRGLRFRTRFTIRLAPRGWTRPDLVFTRTRMAVYVDGCFWHGCPEHGTQPRANTAYWASKLRRNRIRDAEINGQLAELGWLVVRAWEHEDPAAVADQVARLYAERRDTRSG